MKKATFAFLSLFVSLVSVHTAQAGIFDWFKSKPAEQPAAAAATTSAAAPAPASVSDAASAVQASAVAQAGASIAEQSEKALEVARSVKSALASVGDKGALLKPLLASQPQLASLLDKALDAAKKGDDLLALEKLEELKDAAKLTPEQSKLVDGLKKDFEVLALGRNFDSDGPVGDAIDAIKDGETTKAVNSLKELLKQGDLSQKQKDLLSKLIDGQAASLRKLLPF